MNRRLLTTAAIAAAAIAIAVAPAAAYPERIEPVAERVTVTYYYWTGFRTASGEWPHIGTAACSTGYPFGTVFVFGDGRVVRCNDRGHLAHPWVDIYAAGPEEGAAIARTYGATTTVLVVRP